jgi:hypothetical protein
MSTARFACADPSTPTTIRFIGFSSGPYRQEAAKVTQASSSVFDVAQSRPEPVKSGGATLDAGQTSIAESVAF